MKRRRKAFRGLEGGDARRAREASARAEEHASRGACGLAVGFLAQAEFYRGRAEASGEKVTKRKTLDDVMRCVSKRRRD